MISLHPSILLVLENCCHQKGVQEDLAGREIFTLFRSADLGELFPAERKILEHHKLELVRGSCDLMYHEPGQTSIITIWAHISSFLWKELKTVFLAEFWY